MPVSSNIRWAHATLYPVGSPCTTLFRRRDGDPHVETTDDANRGSRDPGQDPDFRHLLGKCREARDAKGFPGHLSTGERLAAALVLDRADWLAEERYTIVEAIDRIGPARASLLSRTVAALEEDHRARLEADEYAPAAWNGDRD